MISFNIPHFLDYVTLIFFVTCDANVGVFDIYSSKICVNVCSVT